MYVNVCTCTCIIHVGKVVASGDFGSNVTVAADTDQDLTSEERNILEGSCDSGNNAHDVHAQNNRSDPAWPHHILSHILCYCGHVQCNNMRATRHVHTLCGIFIPCF